MSSRRLSSQAATAKTVKTVLERSPLLVFQLVEKKSANGFATIQPDRNHHDGTGMRDRENGARLLAVLTGNGMGGGTNPAVLAEEVVF